VGFQILAEVMCVTLEVPAGVAEISDVSGHGLLCGTLFVPFTVVKVGLCEPGQGLSHGPCLRTVPSLWLGCRVTRQTLQILLALLASCYRDHGCDVTPHRTR